jgi:hypothetical protein
MPSVCSPPSPTGRISGAGVVVVERLGAVLGDGAPETAPGSRSSAGRNRPADMPRARWDRVGNAATEQRRMSPPARRYRVPPRYLRHPRRPIGRPRSPPATWASTARCGHGPRHDVGRGRWGGQMAPPPRGVHLERRQTDRQLALRVLGDVGGIVTGDPAVHPHPVTRSVSPTACGDG